MTNFAERYRNAQSHEAKEEIESEAFQVARQMEHEGKFKSYWFPRTSRHNMPLVDWQWDVYLMCGCLDEAIADERGDDHEA